MKTEIVKNITENITENMAQRCVECAQVFDASATVLQAVTIGFCGVIIIVAVRFFYELKRGGK